MNHRERTLRSLEGLSIGDAFGKRTADEDPGLFASMVPPPGPWPWTDDTHMALSVVEQLFDRGEMHGPSLSNAFARRYAEGAHRGYGTGAHRLLSALANGAAYETAAASLHDGQGSWGNGAAMRAAPIGAWFAMHPARAADEARASAVVTHTHPDGIGGAIAVAVAAALRFGADRPTGTAFLTELQRYVPLGPIRDGLARAAEEARSELVEAVRALGNGARKSAVDTVPLAMWVVAYHGDDFEAAMWRCARAGGDPDTLCAIVGGVLGAGAISIPDAWHDAREPLPERFRLARLSS